MYKTAMFLYQSQAVYELDKMAVEVDGFCEIELMQRAGDRVWQEISQRWPSLTCITIFAGSGNNGGDAFVVALRANEAGVAVQFLYKGDLNRQSTTSMHFHQLWLKAGGVVNSWRQQVIEGAVIVDGLLGIGLSRDLDEELQALVANINQQKAFRVAIDIPSGLNADTGVVQPVAVNADLTITFIAAKAGLYLADGPDYRGELVLDDLGVSSRSLMQATPALEIIDRKNVLLPVKRRCNSHKNQFGHVLVIGGDKGMAGAAALAARAALRAGAGVVSVLVHRECVHSLDSMPELMVKSWDELDACIESATVIVVGPGMGQGTEAKACLNKLACADRPFVVDASALTIGFLDSLIAKHIVITPHPGEAAGLLKTTAAAVQSDRIAASYRLVNRFSVTSVLKGSGSLVQQSALMPAINVRGHAGMATAGMGDVLTGLIAALIAQGLSLYDASKTAVLLHALCAEDYARECDETGLIATDIINNIPRVLKRLRTTAAPMAL